MIRKSQVALHVRVLLNENFKPKCLGEEYLVKDKIIYISDQAIYNDEIGDYVHISSTNFNGGYAYLNQLDLEFPIEIKNKPKVGVEYDEYQKLLEDQDKLRALEAYGVDNWDGYSDAMSSVYNEDEDEEDC